MPRTTDPRARAFNYESPPSGKNPPVYHTALQVAHLLSKKASELDEQAHELEMALKDVRIACNGVDKAMALRDLETELAKHIPRWIGEEDGHTKNAATARPAGRDRPRARRARDRQREEDATV